MKVNKLTQKYTVNQIKNAGKRLIQDINDSEALEILSYWRADHAWPLEQAYKDIEKYARRVDGKAIVAKRLKRAPSIISKLKLLQNRLQLSTMNDIGGCRIIVKNEKTVYKLVREIRKHTTFVLRVDYIKDPRDSGYRSVHLVGKYNNKDGISRDIELQIRTKIQHSWATAVEIVDIFTNQSIKSNIGEGNWPIFFKQAGLQFTLFDNNPYLNSITIANKMDKNFAAHYLGEFGSKYSSDTIFRQSAKEVSRLSEQLNILNKFQVFTQSLHFTSQQIEQNSNEGYYLIVIEYDGQAKYTIGLKFFKKDDIDIATSEYSKEEKQTFLNKKFLTALISTSKVGNIAEAYPNYFADSSSFAYHLGLVIAAEKRFNSTIDKISLGISKLFSKK